MIPPPHYNAANIVKGSTGTNEYGADPLGAMA